MSRERDSEIIYELVTSKYKIAERNRLAKIRFLSSMNDNGSSTASSPVMVKRHDSEPSLAKTERVTGKPADLSVPGTPVSSRYIKSLRKGRFDIETDSEGDDGDDEEINQQEQQSLLTEGLKQFTNDMESLQKKSHDPLKEYFESADESKSYKREFSEVVSEITLNKPEPKAISKIERYFKESERRGSLTRDFTEVVQNFDPQNPSGREQFKSLAKPGTPISSKFIKVEKVKLEPFTENMKKLEKFLDEEKILKSPRLVKEVAPEKPKRVHPVPLTPTIIPPSPTSPAFPIEEPKEAEVSTLIVITSTSEEVKNLSEDKISVVVANPSEIEPEAEKQKEKKLKRSNSNVSFSSTRSDISVPGTPVDSRHLINNDDTDSDIEIIDSEEIKALAQEFSEKIGELVQKSEEEEDKKDEKKLLIIYDDKSGESESIQRVKDYLERSEKEKTYQREFSEVANFNEPSLEVKQKVEKFFKESDEKKTFTRGFSEAINYVEPVNIEDLFKPGTPVSSKTVQCLKKKQFSDEILLEDDEVDPELLQGMEAFLKAHDAIHNTYQDFKADQYFDESKERKTLRRDFSEVFGELGATPKSSQNPEVSKYFEQSDAQKSFQRQFSEALQTLPPRMKDILIEEAKKKRTASRASRASSVSSASEAEGGKKKKYAVDKYFAASLYRTAYHRLLTERRGSEPNNRLAIVEDENVFGETDLLRSQVFQDDDETPVRMRDSENYEQQNVQFWREFLKPYNLNLPTDIVMRDELIDKYAKYTLE